MLPTSGEQGGPVLPETGKSAQLGRVFWGRGCLPVTHLDRGHFTPKEGPCALAGAPRLGDALEGEAGRELPAGRGLQRLP